MTLGDFWSTDTQSELAAGQAEAASGHWQEWRLFTFPERPEHPRTLLLQRWPHGPSLHLKPAHRQDVEATVYPRPSQKESAKKSAVKAGESARGTAFDAERGELGRVGQGNVNRAGGKWAQAPDFGATCPPHLVSSWNACWNFANASPSLPVDLNILPMTSSLL